MGFTDFTFWLYVLLASVNCYGFFLFIWWWKKKGSASAIYGYVTFLLFGLSFRSIIDAYARFLYSTNIDILNIFLHSWIWSCRLLITLIFSSAIILHMSYRAFIKGTKIVHYTNPLHIWCRLLDLHIPAKLSRKFSIQYERWLDFIGKDLSD